LVLTFASHSFTSLYTLYGGGPDVDDDDDDDDGFVSGLDSGGGFEGPYERGAELGRVGMSGGGR
jgi:hypothetical protein